MENKKLGIKNMESNLKTKVSRYISYLLRHNPRNLRMDKDGFVNIDELMDKLKEHFQIDKKLLFEIVEKSERKRFEIFENRIRALYGHTLPVTLEFEEDNTVKVLYHGTTQVAAAKILRTGLERMKRKWVHLSPTIEIAIEVGKRRTNNPVILEIDAEAARKAGVKFYKTTDKVYICSDISPIYIKIASHSV